MSGEIRVRPRPSLLPSCAVGIFFFWMIPIQTDAHPHYRKEILFRWDPNGVRKESVVLSHLTVPYNEIKAASLPVGETWHLGFARFETTTDLENGRVLIPPGRYDLKVRRDAPRAWSLVLLKKDVEGRVTGKIELEEVFTSDLLIEQHLRLDVHPKGDKNKTTVWVFVRFGPYGIKFPISLPQ